MRVRHLKVSNVPDGPDTGSVRPSDWNADHVIDQTSAEITLDYTLSVNDNNTVLKVDSATPVDISLPSNLTSDYSIKVIQIGIGAVTFVPLAGATLVNRSLHTSTAGQYAVIDLFVISNTDGSSAVYVLSGDTA